MPRPATISQAERLFAESIRAWPDQQGLADRYERRFLRKDGTADDLDPLVNWTTSQIDIAD